MIRESQIVSGWKPSNLEPVYRVLPSDSPLREGVPMLDRVLFAFSNTELKSAMLFYGLDRSPASMSAVEERMRSRFPLSWPEVPQPYKVLHFMRSFICAAGFAEESPERYFLTTPDGEGIAKDSAAFFLSKAVDLGAPFGSIIKERFDGRIDGWTRAYILRLSILFALKEGRALSHRVLNEKLGAGAYDQVLWNLRALAERKLVLYEVSEDKPGQSVYERGDLSLAPGNLPQSAQNLIKYFVVYQRGNPELLSALIGRSRTHTGKLLFRLAQTGVIRAVNDAKITPLGLRFITEVIEPMLAAYSGDELGLQMLVNSRMRLLQDSNIAVRALDRYKSPSLVSTGLSLKPAPKLGKYAKELSTADFWIKLAENVRGMPSGTAIDSFLRRFDPSFKGSMGSGLHHGIYYNLRQAVARSSKSDAGVFLLSYRPPANASPSVLLTIRGAQQVIREHLEVKDAQPDNFSDIPMLVEKKAEMDRKLILLKSFFNKYGQFNEEELTGLKNINADQIKDWLVNLRGHDIDAFSFASIGFHSNRYAEKFTHNGFPPELRAAFLIYSFEQQRRGGPLPVLSTEEVGYSFRNIEVKKALQVLEQYLNHYQQEAKRKSPNAVLSVFSLVSFLKEYVESKVS